jgi:glycosyltransferase involved in cell wall biosynthesis
LLDWFPKLEDKTNGYTDYSVLANRIESLVPKPDYIIRNGTHFGRINTNVPTISLLQDVQENKTYQCDVLNNSTAVVCVSNYVLQKYIHLLQAGLRIEVIPIGIDFSFFKPISERYPSILPDSVLFIGAATDYPKGFHILRRIISKMNTTNFCLIMKDGFNVSMLPESERSRVVVFNRISSADVCRVINSCKVAVCTSLEETEHLSGIECMACNIPVVARPVGIYYDSREDTAWGLIANDENDFPDKITYVLNNLNLFTPRDYASERFSTEICKIKWTNLIKDITS